MPYTLKYTCGCSMLAIEPPDWMFQRSANRQHVDIKTLRQAYIDRSIAFAKVSSCPDCSADTLEYGIDE